SEIFATERLMRAEVSSTLRSNSVIHTLPAWINVHACVAVTRLHYYRGLPPGGQLALCGRLVWKRGFAPLGRGPSAPLRAGSAPSPHKPGHDTITPCVRGQLSNLRRFL